MKALKQILKNYFRHDCFYLSTHISYCALLSMIPLLLIAVSVVGFLLGSYQDVYHQLVEGIVDVLPTGKEFLVNSLNQIVGQRHSMGVIGFCFLIFIATLLFAGIERALDVIYEAPKSRSFLRSRLLAILMIGLISLFFFLPTLADLLTRGLAQFGVNFPLVNILKGKVFFLLFSFFAFLLINIFIPHLRVRVRYAALGGVVFALGIFVAKQIFRWYMMRAFSHYNLIYGSLTAIILLMLWIFYTSNILLFSSELVAYFQSRHSGPFATRLSHVYKSLGKPPV